MEISLVLSDDHGTYQTILGQFIETSAVQVAADAAAAAASASAAAASQSAASTSASDAATSAAGAANSASSAAGSATSAASSATSASGSATTATTQAGNASSSATAAASSASTAGTSATNAANSATAAATSASNAATTLANALTKANNLSDVANVVTARSNLGLGTAATANTGTSGSTVPLLNAANTWSGIQTFNGGAYSFSARPSFDGNTPWDSGNLASPASTAGNLSQFAATTSAQLAGVLSDETGSGAAVFGTTPTLTRPNIVGVTAGSDAAAGSVGEHVTASASAVSMTTDVTSNVGSITLTAGDWDVFGNTYFQPAVATTISYMQTSLNTSSASLASATSGYLSQNNINGSYGGGQPGSQCCMPMRVNVAASTTVYLVAKTGFSGGTLTCNGVLRARRVR